MWRTLCRSWIAFLRLTMMESERRMIISVVETNIITFEFCFYSLCIKAHLSLPCINCRLWYIFMINMNYTRIFIFIFYINLYYLSYMWVFIFEELIVDSYSISFSNLFDNNIQSIFDNWLDLIKSYWKKSKDSYLFFIYSLELILSSF